MVHDKAIIFKFHNLPNLLNHSKQIILKILILGSGGREHAFCWKIKQSNLCSQLFIIPGNAGTAGLGENINVNMNDFEELKKI